MTKLLIEHAFLIFHPFKMLKLKIKIERCQDQDDEIKVIIITYIK
jgi:hypothetical protein